jgi:hypothetical protein
MLGELEEVAADPSYRPARLPTVDEHKNDATTIPRERTQDVAHGQAGDDGPVDVGRKRLRSQSTQREHGWERDQRLARAIPTQQQPIGAEVDKAAGHGTATVDGNAQFLPH